jgi:urease accessory protein
MRELQLRSTALLRLLHLASPALPIGTFAYSHGLESAVVLGYIEGADDTRTWIAGVLRQSLRTWDMPILVRMYGAFRAGDVKTARTWNRRLLASRPTAELAEEDRQLGQALSRVLIHLGVAGAAEWHEDPHVTYEAMFALAAAMYEVPIDSALSAYAFAWCEMLVGAATKLVPLGQTQSQQILAGLTETIDSAVADGLTRADDDLSAFAPMHTMASALHESQYSRLFRS